MGHHHVHNHEEVLTRRIGDDERARQKARARTAALAREREKGDAVAQAVWKYLQECNATHLVPWVSNPQANSLDPIKAAEHQGWKRAHQEIKDVILETLKKIDEPEAENGKNIAR